MSGLQCHQQHLLWSTKDLIIQGPVSIPALVGQWMGITHIWIMYPVKRLRDEETRELFHRAILQENPQCLAPFRLLGNHQDYGCHLPKLASSMGLVPPLYLLILCMKVMSWYSFDKTYPLSFFACLCHVICSSWYLVGIVFLVFDFFCPIS